MQYTDFIASKRRKHSDAGFDPGALPGYLYPFQQHAVRWALLKGRAALFEDCGLGKTIQQLVWADRVSQHTGAPVLILAPLAVSEQTKREGARFGLDVNIARSGDDVRAGLNIANYEMLHHFTPDAFGGLVLDESSILKNFSGKYRNQITEFVKPIRYRLACTATPAPNDWIELINHSDFLGVLSGKEAIALFFRQDGNTTHAWRLKGHAVGDFWRWLSTWAMAIRSPADVGFDDDRFKLPKLRMVQHVVDGHVEDGYLFPVEATEMQDRIKARRESVGERVRMCAELVNNIPGPWVVWCALNAESDALRKAIPDAVEVRGSDSTDVKTARMLGFADGTHRVMVTKPSIAGFGMNWQHCANVAFVGLSDSWEQWYQAIRRCWRFGQTREVTAHVIVADTEGAVVANIERKERQAADMMRQLVEHMGQNYTKTIYTADSKTAAATIPAWLGRAAV